MGPLTKALGLKEPMTVAIVGSGGKTTLMYTLAAELVRAGKKVIVTTTTRIYPPTIEQAPEIWLLGSAAPSREEWGRRLAGPLPLCVGTELTEQDKIAGLPLEQFDRLAGLDVWLLVEADGAAERPLKGWAPHEPVLPSTAGLVVAVAGASGLGKPLDERTVHRPELFAKQSGLALDQPVSAEGVARALLGEDGPLRDTPPGARAAILINQADASEPLLVDDLRGALAAAAPHTLLLGGSLAAGEVEVWSRP